MFSEGWWNIITKVELVYSLGIRPVVRGITLFSESNDNDWKLESWVKVSVETKQMMLNWFGNILKHRDYNRGIVSQGTLYFKCRLFFSLIYLFHFYIAFLICCKNISWTLHTETLTREILIPYPLQFVLLFWWVQRDVSWYLLGRGILNYGSQSQRFSLNM